ncbi:hypothetical protein M409DRAFT_56692 [Zasmidium cellare ATCC 36951]|uniref:Uncharacterized protein n=1 Tax=Zasmidium cellare ATCC 36951 TaxID=1080233 RepID=A0A6A6CE31_ZASCE|nr:uncharacterized protein M409DRAFT_56692 [Zasmidium cellare ATCC 36951]KAF2164428.1 hypothetical protein M409DRAFT_56692 [Zasmidium cellare ATCC 36951]
MDNSPLSRLSAELRNRIAEFALTHDVCHVRPSSRKAASHLPGFEFTFEDGRIKHPAGLLQTCKEMKKDYTQLFYASNIFVIHTVGEGDGAGDTAAGFLEAIDSKSAAAMRGLVIELEKWAPLRKDGPYDFMYSLIKTLGRFRYRIERTPKLTQCKQLRFTISYKFFPCGNKDENGVISLQPVFDCLDIKSSLRTESDRFKKLGDTRHASVGETLLCRELSTALERSASWLFE